MLTSSNIRIWIFTFFTSKSSFLLAFGLVRLWLPVGFGDDTHRLQGAEDGGHQMVGGFYR